MNIVNKLASNMVCISIIIIDQHITFLKDLLWAVFHVLHIHLSSDLWVLFKLFLLSLYNPLYGRRHSYAMLSRLHILQFKFGLKKSSPLPEFEPTYRSNMQPTELS